jgi:hypothetical protein
MPRLRLRIYPTGHLEVQVEGMTDGCEALVDEAASRVGVILERRPLPPTPGGAAGAAVVAGRPGRRVDGSSVRIASEPSAG